MKRTFSVPRIHCDGCVRTVTATLKTVADGTRLLILEGPRDADELRWWRLQDRSDGAEGWAAETYLTPATTP